MMTELRELVCQLYDVGAVKFGSFKLKSGVLSPVYFDLRVMVSYPKLMRVISDLLWSKIADLSSEFSCVCGVPYTALPLATLISTTQNIPMLIRRKEAKDYGTKRTVEGKITPGAKCLIVEDVIVSGTSVMETVSVLKKEGMEVNMAVLLLDRQQGGKQNLKEKGITAYSIISLTEMMRILLEAGKVSSSAVEEVKTYLANYNNSAVINSFNTSPLQLSFTHRASSSSHPLTSRLLCLMDKKKTNLALSADVQTSEELLQLADDAGPHICLLKTHVDIMSNFTAATADSLIQLAVKHNFIIMEDRKFADIGNTVQLQYSSPSLLLSSGWAELVTSHALPGPGVINGLRGVAKTGSGCVLVVEMSSQGTLTTSEYTKAAVAMAAANSDFVVGVVSRHRPTSLPAHMVVMTPGVKLTAGSDSLGQQYLTPEKAVLEQGSDIVIVGRGIYTSADPVETAKLFREKAYEAYVKRCNKKSSE